MSSLEELYKEVILDHYRAPRNQGELISPPAIKMVGKNPVCGDELVLYIQIEDNLITDVKISGSGCSISTASASMMSDAIKGKELSFAHTLIENFKHMMNIHQEHLEGDKSHDFSSFDLGELDALAGVVKYPIRVKCATLGFNTLARCLEIAQGHIVNEVATSE